MQAMWAYLGASVLCIMVLVLLVFRSVVLSARLAFAMLATLGATFGAAVVVYQTPLLHGVMPWLKDHYGVTYASVPMCTCIAVALGLDYDIFLVSRIVEFRKAGYTDSESIVRGVVMTGDIISGAGLIMALAFLGLGFSSKVHLQQFSMLLVTSVLLDTFVVRTVLVPALMLSAGEHNWWPRQMPEPVYADDTLDSQRDHSDAESANE